MALELGEVAVSLGVEPTATRSAAPRPESVPAEDGERAADDIEWT